MCVQALDMIKSEDDAERAFQLSSGLTQALLEYRMKSFSNVSMHLKFFFFF